MRLWPFSNEPAPPPAQFIEDRVGYAVGDIHGRADLLAELFTELEARAEADTRPAGPPLLIFLGDYVDRGPDSRAVLDLLLSDRPRGFERRFIKGNHEQAMLAFLEAPIPNRAWLFHGGGETLRSYGIQPPPAVGADDQALTDAAASLAAALPEAHKNFLEALERYTTAGDYAFAHAGVDVSKTLEEQTDADLFWSRDRFLKARRRFPYRVVHGHTPTDKPFADARRIGVDTGAYATGVLTAVRLEGEQANFIEAKVENPRAEIK